MFIKSHELKIIKKILKTHVPEHEVRLFGSRAHGEHLRKFSDLDLAVMTKQPLPLSLHGKLKEAFSDSDLSFKVDVIDWAAIDKSFRKIIEENFEVIQKARN